jgi:3-isopropylmalate/(R)-2-methylmalate dehydratase small subunit
MILKGKAIKIGDDINTDLIIPGRFLDIVDPHELSLHTMEDFDTNFIKQYSKGDIIVAGKNFGCGSSREQAVICLKNLGVKAIIAKSFSRIFYRNAINQGIFIIESYNAAETIEHNDKLLIDNKIGLIKDITKKIQFKIKPLPKFLLEIISMGGVVNWFKNKKLKKNE